jgi:hypothetical protein
MGLGRFRQLRNDALQRIIGQRRHAGDNAGVSDRRFLESNDERTQPGVHILLRSLQLTVPDHRSLLLRQG